MTAEYAKQTSTPDKGVLSVGQEELSLTPDYQLVAGIERWYSAAEAAVFFGRSTQWLYDRIKKGKLTYPDGSLIKPLQAATEAGGKTAYGPMRFQLHLIREIAQCLYRAGTVKMPELKIIMRRVAEAEYGFFDPDAE